MLGASSKRIFSSLSILFGTTIAIDPQFTDLIPVTLDLGSGAQEISYTTLTATSNGLDFYPEFTISGLSPCSAFTVEASSHVRPTSCQPFLALVSSSSSASTARTSSRTYNNSTATSSLPEFSSAPPPSTPESDFGRTVTALWPEEYTLPPWRGLSPTSSQATTTLLPGPLVGPMVGDFPSPSPAIPTLDYPDDSGDTTSRQFGRSSVMTSLLRAPTGLMEDAPSNVVGIPPLIQQSGGIFVFPDGITASTIESSTPVDDIGSLIMGGLGGPDSQRSITHSTSTFTDSAFIPVRTSSTPKPFTGDASRSGMDRNDPWVMTTIGTCLSSLLLILHL